MAKTSARKVDVMLESLVAIHRRRIRGYLHFEGLIRVVPNAYLRFEGLVPE